jgi:purine-binding chemotaxis protein CheW
MAISLAAEPSSDGSAEGADLRQFVAFESGDEVFAVDLAPVQEIIRVPRVIPVPLAPPALEGLANLRGAVLPLVNLRRACGLPPRAHDDATRALVVDAGHPLGLVVDRVSSVVAVEPERIEDASAIRATIASDLIAGVIKDAGGHQLMLVLDVQRLIEREFAALASASLGRAQRGAADIASSDAADADDADDESRRDERPLVSFRAAEQEYAIAIEHVREIVRMPPAVVQVPNAAHHVVGLMLLRQRLLPLVSLRTIFGLPHRDADEQSRIVVVGEGDRSVGIVTDAVNEVLRVASRDLEAVPEMLSRRGELADVAALCRLDDGRRLVSVVDVRRLFQSSTIHEALETMGQSHEVASAAPSGDADVDETKDEGEQVVVLRLGAQEFGVPIDSVQEIVRVPEQLTVVPQAPAFVEGVMNLRGTVLPVVDLRRRLGLESVERNEAHRVMVFVLDGIRTGFIVDAVAEVLRLPAGSVVPAPRLSPTQQALLGRVANLEAAGRIVQLIAPAHLLGAQDLAGVAAMAA